MTGHDTPGREGGGEQAGGRSPPPRADVIVVGGGPSGLAAATACAERGLAVTVLAGDHGARWPQTLGAWTDELDGLGLPGILADRWPAVTVQLGEAQPRRVERAYGRIDNDVLQAALDRRLDHAGGRRVTGQAARAEFGPAGTTVVTVTGQRLECRVAVDASGHRPALLDAGRGRPPAVQAAYGVVGRFSGVPMAAGTMLLMDYRDAAGPDPQGRPGPPTFLYGMPLGDSCHLLEETSLAHRPAMGFATLAARLRRRLDELGVRLEEHVAVERVRIPMGGPLPPHQRVVGFGAAAGMVHPATGYQVATALARAPRLATALASALDRPHADPCSVAAAGWQAVWPEDLRRQRALHTLGLESLLRLDPVATRSFFRAFFDLPQPRWSGFLSGEVSAARLATTMLTLFAGVPGGLRVTLATTAVRNPGLLRDAIRPRTGTGLCSLPLRYPRRPRG